jgi:protocatechuate 3,4-dioxygenase beta subunit
MKTYRIIFNDIDNGTLRAKTAENALVQFLQILSATHILRRGTIADAKRGNRKPLESASVYMWQGAFQRPVFAIATLA